MQVNFNAQIVSRAPAKKPTYQHTQSDSSLRSMLNRANAALAEYRGRVSAMQRRIAQLERGANGEASACSADCGTSELKHAVERCKELEERATELESMVKIEKGRYLAAMEELEKAKAEHGAAKVQFDALKAKFDSTERKLASLKGECASAKKERDALRAECSALKEECDMIKAENEDLIAGMDKIKAKLSGYGECDPQWQGTGAESSAYQGR